LPDRGALIGYGLAGSVFHAPLIAAAPGLRLAAVVTSNPERAAAARDRWPGISVEPSAEAIWEHAAAYDFVVVASPNDSHVSLAEAAIDEGLPVVVDKPLAPTSEVARGLVQRAEQSGVGLTVFHNRRWDSDQLTLRRLITDGSLGDVRRYESRFERWRPEVRPGSWRDAAAPAEGGGVLLDLGTHLVDQALNLFGPARNVYGEVDLRRGAAADDDAFIALAHEGGVRSHLWASAVAGAVGPRLRVLGSRSAYVAEHLDGQEDALREGRLPSDPDTWGAEPVERWGELVRGDEREPVPSERGGWPRFYDRFASFLRGEGPLPVDPHDAVAVLAILERARAGT
jgi:scyllo-inositol 2-dehydrogenase (NADP+)